MSKRSTYKRVDDYEPIQELTTAAITTAVSTTQMTVMTVATVASAAFLTAIFSMTIVSYNQFGSTNFTSSSGSVDVQFPAIQNVTVLNPTTTVSVDNFPPFTVTFPDSVNITISNPVTTINVTYPGTMDVQVLNYVSIANFPDTQPISGSVSVSSLPSISGTVAVSNFPATQPVSGSVSVSNLPSTQTINGTVNVANFPATQPVSGSVSVSNFPTSQDVNVLNAVLATSVSNFPATQNVNVTNSVSVNNFPATQSVYVTNPTTTVNVTGTTYPVDEDGHPYVNIATPLSAFGSVMTESLDAVFQTTAVYGLNTQQVNYGTIGSAATSVDANDSIFTLTSGTTFLDTAYLQSRKRLRYRAGQGSRCMFTAAFTSNTTLTYQIAGLGNPEDGMYFGYAPNGKFGILHSERGKREVRKLTITTGSSTAQSVTITLNSVAFSVPVTNSAGNTLRTAYEIARFIYTGWDTQLQDSTVTFVSDNAGAKAGTFSMTASTAVGTFSRTQIGAATTETWIYQESWNINKMPTLDPSKLNVYMISMQYLGAGAIRFFIESQGGTDHNTPEFINVHTFVFPNTRTTSIFGNPSFPFTAATYNLGYTGGNITVKSASFAGFVEGHRQLTGNRYSVYNTLTTVDTAGFYILFTIYNPVFYNGRASQGVINLLSVSGAVNANAPVEFYVFKVQLGQIWNVTGNPNFQPYNANSAVLVDKSALLFSTSTTEQIVSAHPVAQDSDFIRVYSMEQHEEITLQPGEYLSLCAKSAAGAVAYTAGSISFREDY